MLFTTVLRQTRLYVSLRRIKRKEVHQMIERELLINLLNNADMNDERNQKTIRVLYEVALKRIKMTDSNTQRDDISELYNSLDDRRQRLVYVFARGLSDKN